MYQTLDTFHELYEEKRIATFGEGRPDLAVQAVITYDAMWLAALALDAVDRQLKTMSPPLSHFDIDYNETIPLPSSLSDFDYANQNGTIIKELFYQTALNTTFPGASVSNFQYILCFSSIRRIMIGYTNLHSKEK